MGRGRERERGIGRNCKKDSVQNISFKKIKNEEEEEEKVQHLLKWSNASESRILLSGI